MTFGVEFTNKAEKNLRKIPEPFKKKLFVAACALGKNPFPRGLEKLTDRDNSYRVGIGQYRIVWFIDYAKNIVWIVNIDKRSKVY